MIDMQIIRRYSIFDVTPSSILRYGVIEDHRRFETYDMAHWMMKAVAKLYGTTMDGALVSMTLTDDITGATLLEWLPQEFMRLMSERED